MTNLLSQIEAAAALGAKAADAARIAEAQLMDPCGRAASLASQYRFAAANLPLAAIAEELRAKDAEIKRLGALVDAAHSLRSWAGEYASHHDIPGEEHNAQTACDRWDELTRKEA